MMRRLTGQSLIEGNGQRVAGLRRRQDKAAGANTSV
jgi:hypothetical protein